MTRNHTCMLLSTSAGKMYRGHNLCLSYTVTVHVWQLRRVSCCCRLLAEAMEEAQFFTTQNLGRMLEHTLKRYRSIAYEDCAASWLCIMLLQVCKAPPSQVT